MSSVFEAPFNKMLYRPCIVVSTISSNGVSNAAPFSFNSPATTKPPTYGFCCEVEHDTLRNIRENNEFVVNLVGEDFGPLMKDLARDLPYVPLYNPKLIEAVRNDRFNGWVDTVGGIGNVWSFLQIKPK